MNGNEATCPQFVPVGEVFVSTKVEIMTTKSVGAFVLSAAVVALKFVFPPLVIETTAPPEFNIAISACAASTWFVNVLEMLRG